MKKFFKEFRTEIIVIGLLVIGFGLLASSFSIRKGIQQTTFSIIRQTGPALKRAFDSVINYILSLSILDIVGWILILAGILYIYGRIRYRYRHNPRWEASICPRCESSIKRVHRNLIDRLLAKTLMPTARRYRCTNPECNWGGLRHQRYHIPRVRVDEINRNQQTPLPD